MSVSTRGYPQRVASGLAVDAFLSAFIRTLFAIGLLVHRKRQRNDELLHKGSRDRHVFVCVCVCVWSMCVLAGRRFFSPPLPACSSELVSGCLAVCTLKPYLRPGQHSSGPLISYKQPLLTDRLLHDPSSFPHIHLQVHLKHG